MAKKIDYPAIKKVAWRFIRVSISGGLSSLAIALLEIESPETRGLLIVFLTGAIQAFTKWLRENADYDSLIHKLLI